MSNLWIAGGVISAFFMGLLGYTYLEEQDRLTPIGLTSLVISVIVFFVLSWVGILMSLTYEVYLRRGNER